MNEEMLKRFAKAYKNVRQKRKYVSHDGKNVLTIKPVFDWEGFYHGHRFVMRNKARWPFAGRNAMEIRVAMDFYRENVRVAMSSPTEEHTGMLNDMMMKFFGDPHPTTVSFKCQNCGKTYPYVMGENCPHCGKDRV